MYPAFYDPNLMKPSRIGIDYLLPIFTDAIGEDDMEYMRRTLFSHGNLAQPYHSINTDVNKRIRYLEPAIGEIDTEIETPTDGLAQHSKV
jgi:ATP-dependent phosphofructokinase / diphosphate-dependent phosphofructokinase